MNRDSTIIQVALFLIVIAILGVAILRQQTSKEASNETQNQDSIVSIQEGSTNTLAEDKPTQATGSDSALVVGDQMTSTSNTLVEQLNSRHANLVKQYFSYIANKEYGRACNLVAGTKCMSANPIALETFSTEFQKMTNGYEYVSVRDYGIVAPSGKNVVCVKYNYRYKDDANPGLISEILSFYTDEVDGNLMITNRVCEKKYKAGRGVRDCPIQAAVEFCEGKIK